MEVPYSINYPEPSGPPQLTTFYSFKGGVGRTQSLYNVGVRLAALRRKVLMLDVDLEAPGLSIGAPLDDEEKRSKDGFAEIAADLLYELKIALKEPPSFFVELVEDYQKRLDNALHVITVPMEPRHADLADRLQEEMNLSNLPSGSLALLSSGRIDPDYPRKMIDVKIDEAFTQELSDEQQDKLPELLDAAGLDLAGVPDNLGLVFTAVLRYLLRHTTDPRTDEHFRHVLIDSRSGLADVGGLCLRGLPDTRVVLSGLNKQNLEGTKMVLDTLSRAERASGELITVFSPVPEGEANLVDERIEKAKDTLTFGGPEETDRVSEDQIRLLHYHPRIALEETPFTESFHKRTRIYDEYEKLTDHLLALTQSDADSLIDQALEHFQEGDAGFEESYRQLPENLLPAAFVDTEQVESLVEGLCTQANRAEVYTSALLPLFQFWVSLSSDDPEPLTTSATFIASLATDNDDIEKAKSIHKYSNDLFERAIAKSTDNYRAWNNWGTSLGQFGDHVKPKRQSMALSLYEESTEKLEKAIDVDPNEHGGWYNWGKSLGSIASLVEEKNPKRAESKYQESFEKLEKSVEIEPDMFDAWNVWGFYLGKLGDLIGTNDPKRAENFYRKSFEKYSRATDVEPERKEVWENWGIDLIHMSQILFFQDRDEEALEILSDGINKLYESLSKDEDPRSRFWLITALAKRDQDDDLEKAADHLRTLLEENPNYLTKFGNGYGEAVRDHPELREILDEYREKVDEDELEEADHLDEMDAPDLSE